MCNILWVYNCLRAEAADEELSLALISFIFWFRCRKISTCRTDWWRKAVLLAKSLLANSFFIQVRLQFAGRVFFLLDSSNGGLRVLGLPPVCRFEC